MKEYLFRGKAINRPPKGTYRTNYENGDWVYGLIDCHNDYETTMINTRGISNIDVDEKTVGLFTGRLDNHKNKIFEGDILKLTSKFFNYTVKVVYDNDECRFIGETADGQWKEFACLGQIEVIGNIYDNPELGEII